MLILNIEMDNLQLLRNSVDRFLLTHVEYVSRATRGIDPSQGYILTSY
jgi:hypothetical protein